MTPYELSFTPTFYNESLSLPKQISKLVSQKLKVLAEDPARAAVHLRTYWDQR